MNWDVFKKPGVESKTEAKPEAKPISQKQVSKQTKMVEPQPVDFNGLSDSDKQCWKYVSENYSGAQDPVAWASYHSQLNGLPEEGLRSAAQRFKGDLAYANGDTEKVHKWPWWSAARNWNPDSNIWGNKKWTSESRSILGFQPSQSIINGVQSGPNLG